jgi:copper homeostasis protein
VSNLTSDTRIVLEVCAADLRSVVAAHHAGADRIELCAALSEGGITPSVGLVVSALNATHVPIRVMIRPRSGDFYCSQKEIEQMVYDIKLFNSLNINGYVIGVLDADGHIDTVNIQRLVDAMENRAWTFHRAFDFCPDPFKELETIIALGADTLLTSGQAASAIEGADLLKALVNQAADRIVIMAGAGINPDNIALLHSQTGCAAFHLSARSTLQNHLPVGHPVRINAGEPMPDHLCKVTDAGIISRAREAILLSQHKNRNRSDQ